MSDLLEPIIIPSTLDDLSVIQKLWPFYVYDLSRECELTKGWDWLIDLSGEKVDLTAYFSHADKKAFLIKVENKLIGFALISKLDIMPEIDFFLSEFFIAGNYQNKGFGKNVAIKLFNFLKGKWALGVIPENKKGLAFWRKTLTSYTVGTFSEIFKTSEELETVECPEPYPMIIFTYNTSTHNQNIAEQAVVVSPTSLSDIPIMVQISYEKHKLYEKAQPQFWKYAGDIAELSQAKWFEELLAHDNHIMLTAKNNQKTAGFIIGKLMPAPEVYNPDVLTLMIDDFLVADEAEWNSIGSKLVQEIKTIAKMRNAAQVLVVCGTHDESKRRFLMNQNLFVASEWFVGGVT